MKKYETGKNTKEGISIRNMWFRKCETNQRPYVVIKPKIKYASVEFDYINLSIELEEILRKNSDELYKTNIETFHKYCGKKSRYSISFHIVVYQMIPIENAHDMAEELYDNIAKIIPF